ncbi:fatty acid synthase-like [Brevipalpus obovatus]|uniref:fatty acid synthase-like n=1 Tax=Brevipalpus obovatus TaxID=246614 RepID=UPI003D9EE2CF
MANLKPNVSFIVGCLAWAFKREDDIKRIASLLQQGIESGEVKPIPSTVYLKNEIQRAFSTMARGNHVGKLLIKMKDQTPESNSTPDIRIESVCETFFNPKKCYIIVGGLGGMGLELVDWMVRKRARKIIITSRSGIKTNLQKFYLKRARMHHEQSVQIKVQRVDLTNERQAIRFIKESSRLGPIGGIFNLAAVLHDGLLENQTVKDFEEVCYPKIRVTRSLDSISRLHCPHLDHFVCFSSIASFGNLGQSNYGFANSFMERLCEKRRKDGLPGLAIQWGPVGDVGLAQRTFGDSSNVAGFEPQKISSCLKMLDFFMQLPHPIGYSAIPSIQIARRETGDALFQISRILGTKEIHLLNPKLSLRELGLDSVQAIEVHNYLEQNLDLSIGQSRVYDITLEQILKMISVGESFLLPELNEKEKLFRPLKKDGSNPIFFFPPAVFDFLSMIPLALGMNRQVYGIEFTEELHQWKDWDKIINYLCDKLLTYFPDEVRYDFLSYSIGAPYAFDMARRIQAIKGDQKVSRIVFIDSSPMALQGIFRMMSRVTTAFGNVKFNINELQGFIRRLDKQFGQDWRGNVLNVSRHMLKDDEVEDPLRKFSYIADMALEPKLKVTAILFKAQKSAHALEERLTDGLDRVIDGEIRVIPSPGSHMDIMLTSRNLIIEEVNKFLTI